MSSVEYKEVTTEEDGQRLDNYLIRILKGVPKSHIYRIIRGGEVRVNKKRAKINARLAAGDIVRVPPVRISEAKPVFVGDKVARKLKASIIYEDASLLVINKPAGIAVHGGSGLSLGVIEALRKLRPELPYLELVHRLDKETSGCLLLAKKRSALRSIQALLASREIHKTYWAILINPWGGPKRQNVSASLEKNTLKSGERVVKVDDQGKASETEFTLIENFKDACLVAAKPKTGRTHQIRVHSLYINHPILGDAKYGELAAEVEGIDNSIKRLFLHAQSIAFTLNGVEHKFEASLDERFSGALQQLRTRS